MPNSLKCRLKNLVRNGLLRECDLKRIIIIPPNATNGDVIKAVFPSIDFTEIAFTVHATTSVTSNGVKGGISYDFWKDWWNAPYEIDQEVEK